MWPYHANYFGDTLAEVSKRGASRRRLIGSPKAVFRQLSSSLLPRYVYPLQNLKMELGLEPPDSSLRQWKVIFFVGALAYVLLVRSLRYQRANRLQKQYAPAGRESFRHMSTENAQAILKTLAELEIPKLYGFSMVVALFRVRRSTNSICYAIMTDIHP